MDERQLDRYSINVIKGLVMDATRQADSGHPGGAMSSVDFAYILFHEFLNFCPSDPQWIDRDRFVLSAGHESMLLYALLTLVGHLRIADLKEFRQSGSRTPGHPEVHLTPGVEATTGPLGQGFGMAVGMAVAEEILAERFGSDLIDHFTYVVASDGDLQEPVTTGAAALAGHWRLGKLIVFYDKNDIQISGRTERSDTTDYATLFEGLGWHVQEIDGHDHRQIRQALRSAHADTGRPSLIIGRTIIARGTASMEGLAKTHGEPLPPEEIAATKKRLGLPAGQPFFLPDDVVAHFRRRFPVLEGCYENWRRRLAEARRQPAFAEAWRRTVEAELPENLNLPEFAYDQKLATRVAFGAALEALATQLPGLVGGSADLEPSNKTDLFMKVVGDFGRGNRGGRNLVFGVREFPMAAILNGLALHGGFIPFGATFLIFSDYERPALRLAALQELRVVHEFTHDSIFLGEDGPTHQPVEHLASLRSMPNFLVIRPADANETAEALRLALEQRNRPTALILTRQSLPVLDRRRFPAAAQLRKGAYILQEPPDGPADVILIATGSEVHLALEAAAALPELRVRVVNMPSWELFDAQPAAYRERVLPPEVPVRVSLEAGSTLGWKKYTGDFGLEIGIDRFGASGKAADLAQAFGFTVENVVRLVRRAYASWRQSQELNEDGKVLPSEGRRQAVEA